MPGRTDLILRASAFLALIGDKSLKGGQAGSTQSAAYEASFVGVRAALHAVLREAAAPAAAAPAAAAPAAAAPAAAAPAAPPSPDAVLVRGGRGEDGEGDRDPATSSSGLKRKRMLGAILDEHAPTSPAQAQPEAPEATSPADASSACTNSELAEIFASPVPPHPTAAPVVETQAEAEAEASGVSEDVGARWSLVFGSPLRGAEAEAEAETAAEAEATSETQLSGK
jgi:transcription termination factor Rho